MIRRTHLRFAARLLLVAGAWVTAIAIATNAYGTFDLRQRFEELWAFACSFAVASALSMVLALAMGGRRHWAAESALAMGGLVAAVAGAGYTLLWITPGLFLRVFYLGQLLTLRQRAAFVAADFRQTYGPLGAAIGIAVGAVAGLLMRLARRRPRLAGCLAAGLLIGFASVGHRLVFAYGAELVLSWRREGGKWAVSGFTGRELSSALGAGAGALLGTIAVGFANWRGRGASGS